ncbi:hypothetical protein L228DRAFT_280918 [Xylona heveae TC161]|uniref:Uncharacterized protein n=1 Tax=Xylona heveae (strain CBS 132557 / TC161) TaxID=1328760 RepID=A0A165J3Y0_XYLHT|nr:hypothetical protein L228DRAFT_280918 [Xylona heveae TC161]KZF25695.1 hypothetical protein L228DRAFT_280918 [Xylona heveae TC161]
MSLPAPKQGLVGFGTTWEREFYKYLPPYCLQAPFDQHVSKDTQYQDSVARSCPDAALTAFAQLGALRLDVQWAMISLFGPNNQHVVAEATRTLSLQNDMHHNEHDELWHGCCTLSYERSFCKHVLDLPQSAEWPDNTILAVPDLTKDGRFQDSRDVNSFPHARFLASVPIISPKGLIIGAYTVVDNKPHNMLDTKSLKFLGDMALTVMDHLENSRSKLQHLRAERMMVGIGSFNEGKGSLRNRWLQSSRQDQNAEDGDEGLEGQINQLQQTKQRSENATQSMADIFASKHLPPPQSPRQRLGVQGVRQRFEQQNSLPKSTTDGSSHAKSESEGGEKSPRQGDNMTLSNQVEGAFSRAANIARESIEVEGVVYFNANFASYGGLVNNPKSASDYSSSESSALSDDDNSSAVSSSPTGCNPSNTYDSGKWVDPCEVLGFSTTELSSVNHEVISNRSIAISELFVKGLLHRYPRGKIFNFSEDGSISSSDESNDGRFKSFFQRENAPTKPGDKSSGRVRTYKRTRKRVLQEDANALLQFAPGSRSIIVIPLWDSDKERWYSGCVAWTRTPHRVFTSDDELTFLFALGNSLMAEVHRLGAEYAERAKSDMLSSLSHELRSPLHGVCGTAELLSDTLMDVSQQSMVHTIESCANTLLDTIDHLLEYSGINQLRKSTSRASAGHGDRHSPRGGMRTGADNTLQDTMDGSKHLPFVQLDAILEEVAESVFAGYAYLHGSMSTLRETAPPGSFVSRNRKESDSSSGPVRIILDIRRAMDWRLLTHPGKWRRILMDIFGNALKFTSGGYIFIMLDASPIKNPQHVVGKPTEYQVTMTVKDTGSGMEQAYLDNDLFAAFSQENTLSAGNGLGLHVTQQTISSLGGEIQVNSRKDFGTEVVTRVNLWHQPDLAPPNSPDEMSVTTAARELTRGKTIGILVLRDSEVDKTLCSSLEALCRDWFDMVVHTARSSEALGHYDYYIATREDLDLASITLDHPPERLFSPIIVICSTPASTKNMWSIIQERADAEVVECICQPCGPQKMAKTLKLCTQRQQQRHDLAAKAKDAAPSSNVSELPHRASVAPGAARGEDSNIATNATNANNAKPTELPEEVGTTKVSTPSTNEVPNPSNEAAPISSKAGPDQGGRLMDNERTQNSQVPKPPEISNPAITVLVVDDNEINARILTTYMKKLGCNYMVAYNGLEAFEAFKAEPARFSVILMDISMPIMDGLDSTRHIRELEKQLRTPKPATIVALTGLGQEGIQRDAIASGMDLFFAKPVPLKQLAQVIEETKNTFLS